VYFFLRIHKHIVVKDNKSITKYELLFRWYSIYIKKKDGYFLNKSQKYKVHVDDATSPSNANSNSNDNDNDNENDNDNDNDNANANAN
jgi:hypothetical protein